MGDTAVVRLATAGDGSAVAALRAAWTEEWHDATPDCGYAERFAAWWASEGAQRLTWLAWADAVPVGMVNLAVFERMPSPGRAPSRWGHVGNAYVRPDWRSRGVGTALLTELLALPGPRGSPGSSCGRATARSRSTSVPASLRRRP